MPTSRETSHFLDPLPAMTFKISNMLQPKVFDHPVDHIELIETHISWVILTGDFAYKIKKPVDFGFLDFSTLDKRRDFCEQELRLNRRLASGIYLDIVSIAGNEDKIVSELFSGRFLGLLGFRGDREVVKLDAELAGNPDSFTPWFKLEWDALKTSHRAALSRYVDL